MSKRIEQLAGPVRAMARLVLCVLLCAAPALAFGQEQPALVEVDAVRAEPLSQTTPVIGRIVTRQRGPVAARVAGLVEDVAIEVGDRVAAGDVLVGLDDEPLTLARDLAAAEFGAMLAEQNTVQAQLELLKGELERITGLQQSAAFSRAQLIDKQHEIAVAESRIAEARARLGQFRAKLQLAARDLEDAVIRAPYAGVISVRHVSAGAYIRTGDPVVTMIDDHQLEIEAEVPSDRVAALTPGTVVTARLDDGSLHEAEVRAVVPEEDPLTRTRAVRFTPRFGATDKPLAVAQSVTVELPIGRPREVVTVNKDGVIQSANGAAVYLVENDAAALRPVRLGEAVGGRFEVLGGLAPGDLVVVRGNERLRPGQPVTYPGAHAKTGTGETES